VDADSERERADRPPDDVSPPRNRQRGRIGRWFEPLDDIAQRRVDEPAQLLAAAGRIS
jgi:hypothetical protein